MMGRHMPMGETALLLCVASDQAINRICSHEHCASMLLRVSSTLQCRDTHLGHALNKILKSIIVQFKLLTGAKAR